LKIRAAADRDRDEILARANARASDLRGKAESEASEHLAVFQQEPRLAEFLLKLTSLEQTLRERSTLILDENTPPFDLLKNQHPAGRSVLAERPLNLIPAEAPKTAAQPQP
jgi:modulator of FtsH protease HflC